jgi:hypothetical protein
MLQINAPLNKKVVECFAFKFESLYGFKKLVSKSASRKAKGSSAATFYNTLVVVTTT